jgi:hypothetical protein
MLQSRTFESLWALSEDRLRWRVGLYVAQVTRTSSGHFGEQFQFLFPPVPLVAHAFLLMTIIASVMLAFMFIMTVTVTFVSTGEVLFDSPQAIARNDIVARAPQNGSKESKKRQDRNHAPHIVNQVQKLQDHASS